MLLLVIIYTKIPSAFRGQTENMYLYLYGLYLRFLAFLGIVLILVLEYYL